ncbi:Insulin-degrading enzyme-like protein [Leptotrombidium deliense]|uniref:Insulin-degrading enzyme-like protein n=1 Tax=Leptotrombidium deliense TaxID=299467 RepID=A0A443SB08_9ACAR|nr:Insulin-degrading enzyme-like protein [Leptotrombidium deliense]
MFPSDCEYNNYIAQHGGYCNAYTTGSHTNYHFDISSSYFKGAVERFVEFFLTPLFTENCTERELNSVNSEHEKNLKEDAWRLLQINRVTADLEHDYSKFSTGNRETLKVIPESLGINVRQSLLDFHSQWYSANIMSLAVLGKEPLDELTDLVVTQFKNIENKGVVVPIWDSHPFREAQLKKIIKIVPVKDIRTLKLSFPIPDLKKYYKSQPGHYLSHLVGHEGKGSLLSYLKQLKLCTSLVAGSRSHSGFGFFNISVELTESGILRPNKVVEAIFGYLLLLKEKHPEQWIFEELKNVNAIRFKFMEKLSPIDAVRRASNTMQDYPLDEVMSANILLDEFRPDVIEDLLKMFKPENCRVTIVGKIFEKEADQCEKWYGAKYTVSDMDASFLQQLQNVKTPEAVHLPAPNEFVPSNLELVEREDKFNTPSLLINNETCRLWFRQDNIFLVPKALFSIIFSSPFVDVDPLYTSAVSLFTALLRDSLEEYAYDAELAGLSYSLNSAPFGFKLTLFGFNEKLNILLLKIVQRMSAFEAEKNLFEIFKEIHFRRLRNFEMSSIRVLLSHYTSLLLSEKCWSYEELLKVESQLTYDKFKEAMQLIFSKLHLEIFADGNLTSNEACFVLNEIEKILRANHFSTAMCDSQLRRNREYQLPEQSYHVYEVSNAVQADNGVYVYLQTGQEKLEEKMKLELLQHILSSHCYNSLRTAEQLGYIVFCGVRSSSGVQGMRIVVQSERHPEYVEKRIENFIEWAQEYLKNLSQDEYEEYKKGILVKKADKPKQLIQSSFEAIAEIYTKEYLFDRRNTEISALEKLTKKEVVDFFDKYIAVDANSRKKLVVRVVSTQSKMVQNGEIVESKPLPENVIRINNVNEFQNSLSLYPLPKPYISFTQDKL